MVSHFTAMTYAEVCQQILVVLQVSYAQNPESLQLEAVT
jgi:hypothetical protein